MALSDGVQHRRTGIHASPALLGADPAVLVVFGMTLALLGAKNTQVPA